MFNTLSKFYSFRLPLLHWQLFPSPTIFFVVAEGHLGSRIGILSPTFSLTLFRWSKVLPPLLGGQEGGGHANCCSPDPSPGKDTNDSWHYLSRNRQSQAWRAGSRKNRFNKLKSVPLHVLLKGNARKIVFFLGGGRGGLGGGNRISIEKSSWSALNVISCYSLVSTLGQQWWR